MLPPDPFPPAGPGLDAWVRSTLDADARAVDAPALWRRVATQLAATAPMPARPRWHWAGAALAALAASVALVLFTGGGATPQAQASPTETVQAVQKAHSAEVERCYRVTVSSPDENRPRLPWLAESERSWQVWTRGNRFVVEPGFNGRGVWGRDAEDRIWFAPQPAAGARFRAEELPAGLRDAVIVRGLELPNLLNHLLAGCDWRWSSVRPAAQRKLTALARSRGAAYAVVGVELTLEVDEPIVKELVILRKLPSGAHLRLSFVRQTTARRAEAAYTVAGHLHADAPVYDHDKPLQRRRVLFQGLGGWLER
jgi:hypothetical protein